MTSSDSAIAQQILAEMAMQWRPMLPTPSDTMDTTEYYPRFDILVGELKDSARAGNLRSTSTLAGQVLEFVLKVALEAAGVGRAALSGPMGTLGSLIQRAQRTSTGASSPAPATILFDPRSVLDASGQLDRARLDNIPHRDLVQHSILQAREYRNSAAHASPWAAPVDVWQASRQLGAAVAICEYLAPSFPPPAGSAETSQIELLRELRARGVDLAIAFLPERSVSRVNEIVVQLNNEEGLASGASLIEAVTRNPTWLFARSAATTLTDLRQLIQMIHSSGHTTLAYIAAVLLPINDLALTYIVRRFGQGLSDHTMMAKRADSSLFSRLLSSTANFPRSCESSAIRLWGQVTKESTRP